MADGKIKILYDATLLSYFSEKNEKRSGVYFVTYNILKEILSLWRRIICSNSSNSWK